jgi:diguanylate cyclase (GGDEF)-like protein
MQRIALLYDASQAVLSSLDSDEVLRQILVIARNYFHLKNVAILLLDTSTQELYPRSQIGWDPGFDNIRIRLDQGIPGAAASEKRPVYSPDVRQDARYVSTCKATLSQVAIPLMVRQELVGVLDCQSDNIDHFDDETVDLLMLFSTQASMALQNAKLYSTERRRAAQMEAISAIAQQTTAVLDIEHLLSKSCMLVQQAFQVSQVAILLKEEEELVLRSHHGSLTARVPEGGKFAVSEGKFGEALTSGKTIVDNDLVPHTMDFRLYEETRSRVIIPLVSFGQSLGLLLLACGESGCFNPHDLAPLESVADICATAIQNAYYVERVRQLAYRDGLTGIFNRRFFEMRMTVEIDRAQRFGSGLAVIMIDIDQFKSLNDDFGHLLGDEVLRQVSSMLHQQVRKIDVVCRYGGEEFAILLAQANAKDAFDVADKLRASVEAWAFPGVPRPVTISAGVAGYPDHGVTRDDLMKAADEGLYAAKQGGRNRVFMAPANKRAHQHHAGKL